MKQIAEKVSGYDVVSYTDLAKVSEQWPKMGREDLYYAGTSYENEDGLGIQLKTAADRGDELSLGLLVLSESAAESGTGVRVLPVTALYDRGRMMQDTDLLAHRLAEQAVLLSPALAKQFKLSDGDKVSLSTADWQAESIVLVDETLPESVAITARSNGLPINEPQYIQIQRLVMEPEA